MNEILNAILESGIECTFDNQGRYVLNSNNLDYLSTCEVEKFDELLIEDNDLITVLPYQRKVIHSRRVELPTQGFCMKIENGAFMMYHYFVPPDIFTSSDFKAKELCNGFYYHGKNKIYTDE